MDSPPDYVIEAARKAAIQSPCAKSKRGVAIFNLEKAALWERYPESRINEYHQRMTDEEHAEARDRYVIASVGFNGQPPPFACSGSDLCRRDCAQLCLHAEERAIRAAGILDDVHDLELVHVKVVDGVVVPGGGPGCAQCSRLIHETNVRGIWLFEQTSCPAHDCPLCTGEMCMECDPGPLRPRCEHDAVERHKGRQPPQGEWQYYGSERFHRLTLRNLKLGDWQ